MPAPVHYVIQIEIDPPNLNPTPGSPGTKSGNFVYLPSLLRCNPGDTVEWRCAHPFSLTFIDVTPTDEVELFADSGTTGPHTITAASGQFHYAVAVYKHPRVFMDASCPHISVN